MASCTPSTTSRAQSFASAGPISRHLLCHLHRHRTPVRAAVSSRAAAPPPRLGPRPPLVLLRHPRLPELVAWPTTSTVTLFSASAFHLHPSSAPPPRSPPCPHHIATSAPAAPRCTAAARLGPRPTLVSQALLHAELSRRRRSDDAAPFHATLASAAPSRDTSIACRHQTPCQLLPHSSPTHWPFIPGHDIAHAIHATCELFDLPLARPCPCAWPPSRGSSTAFSSASHFCIFTVTFAAPLLPHAYSPRLPPPPSSCTALPARGSLVAPPHLLAGFPFLHPHGHTAARVTAARSSLLSSSLPPSLLGARLSLLGCLSSLLSSLLLSLRRTSNVIW